MLRYLIAVIALFVSCASLSAKDMFGNETLHYKVEYKWGLINKTAGQITLKLDNKADRYNCKLIGTSASWADKIFKVRDTLSCTVLKEGFAPIYYEIRAIEGGDRKVETVKYSRSGNTVSADCTRKKWDGKGLVRDDKLTLTADGYTVDMLSSFYYMRTLPYELWTPGHTVSVNIFSGKKKETLTIKYHGKSKLEYDKKVYECYRISFKFTSKGGKKSSEDIDAWLSVADDRLPLKIEGSLPIGKIRCFYTD